MSNKHEQSGACSATVRFGVRIVVMAFVSLAAFAGYSAATVDTSVPGQVTITVPPGEDYTITVSDTNALSTSNTLIKEGAGRLIIDKNMSAWSGDFGISNGYVRLSGNYADGKHSTGTLRLEPGATIELAGAANTFYLRRKYIYVGGTGVNGAGAVYSTANTQSQLFRCDTSGVVCELRLTADTLFKCSPTMGPSAGTMYFNGHKLTVDGGTFEMRGETVYGPGELHAINNCKVWMENGTPGTFYKKASGYAWGANDRSVIRLDSGCSIQQSPQKVQDWVKTRCEWDIACEGDASFISAPSSSGPWTGYYGFYGPISSVAGATLSFEVENRTNIICPLNVTNVLSGGGNILVKCRSDVPAGTLNLPNPNSTISGSLTIQDGVTVNCASLLPSVTNGTFVGTKGHLNLDLSAANLDDDGIDALLAAVNDNLTWPVNVGDAFKSFISYELEPDKTFSKALSEPIVFIHDGTNALTVASAANGLQNYINYSGELILAGVPNEKFKIGWIDVRGGTVTIPTGTYAEAEGSNCVFIATDYPEVARFIVKGTYVTTSTVVNDAGLYPARNYLDSSSTRRGIIELFDGALVTNRIDGGDAASKKATHNVPNIGGAQGAYYQHGGTFITPGGYQYFGSYNNMYVSIEGGKFVNNNNNCRMGRRAGAISFIDITGGRFETQGIGAGQAGAQATVCVSGTGKFISSEGQYFPRRDTEANTGGSHAIFAVDGNGATAECTNTGSHSFALSGQFNSVGEIDLNNGGTMSANGFYKSSTSGKDGTALSGNVVRFSFNGGILRLSANYNGSVEKDKIFRNFTAGTDHVYVHAGGATIDTAGHTLKVGAPLEEPTGNGVESIPLPAEIASLGAWEYIAAPAVTITDPDGTGSGATAVAIFNTTTGKVTGFRVLNRGNNYTSAQATISKGGYTNTFTVVCTLTANASGGFTKAGAGKLVLDCANTYTGATVVAGGTLISSNASALVTTRALKLTGGTLDLTTQNISDLTALEHISLDGGTIVNDAGNVALPNGKCSIDLAAVKEGGCTKLAAGTTLPDSITLLNGELADKADRSYTLLKLPEGYSGPSPVVTGVPAEWSAMVSGRKVRLTCTGFAVIVF